MDLLNRQAGPGRNFSQPGAHLLMNACIDEPYICLSFFRNASERPRGRGGDAVPDRAVSPGEARLQRRGEGQHREGHAGDAPDHRRDGRVHAQGRPGQRYVPTKQAWKVGLAKVGKQPLKVHFLRGKVEKLDYLATFFLSLLKTNTCLLRTRVFFLCFPSCWSQILEDSSTPHRYYPACPFFRGPALITDTPSSHHSMSRSLGLSSQDLVLLNGPTLLNKKCSQEVARTQKPTEWSTADWRSSADRKRIFTSVRA